MISVVSCYPDTEDHSLPRSSTQFYRLWAPFCAEKTLDKVIYSEQLNILFVYLDSKYARRLDTVIFLEGSTWLYRVRCGRLLLLLSTVNCQPFLKFFCLTILQPKTAHIFTLEATIILSTGPRLRCFS